MIIKMEMKNTSDNGPAWKQPWFLFVMGLPAIVVVACFVTLFYAIRSDDGMVTKDYYKEGLAINQDLKRLDYARQMGLNGELLVTGLLVELKLKAAPDGESATNGQPLKLTLLNMGLPNRDQEITLVPNGKGLWRGQLTAPENKGRWQVHLQGADWYLSRMVDGLEGKAVILK
jgi:hypothetical protein